MTHADQVRDLFAADLAGFVWQLGRWQDTAPPSRYAVLRPVGGIGAELIRRPQFTLALVGLRAGDNAAVSAAADAVIETCRAESGALVYVEAGEPVYVPTADGRPILEITLSVIAT